MFTTIAVSVVLVAVMLAVGFVVVKNVSVAAYRRGYDECNATLEKLRNIPIPGMRVDLPTVGEVVILGTGNGEEFKDGKPIVYIDYIESSVLKGRSPADLPDDELSRNTISAPLDSFCMQCQLSISNL